MVKPSGHQISALIIGSLALVSTQSQAAELTLEAAHVAARTVFSSNAALVDGRMRQDKAISNRERLPQLQWRAQLGIQSEVPSIEAGTLPITIDRPLYRAQTSLNLSLELYDGGLRSARLEQLQAVGLAEKVEDQGAEASRIRRVNEAFFAELITKQHLQALHVTQSDLQARQAAIEAGVREGTVLRSELLKIEVRQLELETQVAAASSRNKSARRTLQILTGLSVTDDTVLLLPRLPVESPGSKPERIEALVRRREALLAGKNVLGRKRWPRANLFAEAGLGYPNPLNFFDGGASLFAIAGVNASWALWDWGLVDQEQAKLQTQADLLSQRIERLEQELSVEVASNEAAIHQLEAQLALDEQAAKLRREILASAASQLQHGVLTSADYVNESNAELRARVQVGLTRIDIERSKARYLSALGHWSRRP